MSEHKQQLPEDDGFDALLESSLSELPPDSIAIDVSPWKKAMDRVVIGTALSLVTLNIFYLNYILPLIGMIQLLLGLRRLRQENRAFMACYVIGIVYAVDFFAFLLINATRFNNQIFTLLNSAYANLLTAVISLVYLLCLSGALREVHRKAGLSGRVRGTRSVVIWYIIMVSLALINYSGLVIPIIMLLAYVRIVYCLLKISKALAWAGYSVRCAPARISDRTLVLAILSALAAALVLCHIFFVKYPMNWQPAPPRRSEQAEIVSAQLAELGYPEDLLADLTDEDILACEGAASIIVDTALNMVFDEKPRIYSCGIAVELPGNGLQWRVFHHFRWLEGNRFYGTESIDIQTRWQGTSLFSPSGTFSGQVLCERAGRTCCAPYYSMGIGEYTSYSFFGANTNTHLVARFSLPNRAENQRGYVSYVLELEQQNDYISTWMNYTHQRTWWLYPVSTAHEYFLHDELLAFYKPFVTLQDTLRFFSQQNSEAPA